MKKLIIFIIVIATVLFLTKPSDPDFDSYIKNYIEGRFSNHEKNESVFKKMLGSLSAELGSILTKELTAKSDYYLFTIYEVKLDKQDSYKFIGIAKNFLPLQTEEPFK